VKIVNRYTVRKQGLDVNNFNTRLAVRQEETDRWSKDLWILLRGIQLTLVQRS
jgi:hypothetical protein